MNIDTGWRKDNKCPYCNKKLDAASCFSDLDAIPSPGDLTVCFGCLGILEFDKDLNLIKCDIHKLSMEEKETINKMQRTLKYYKDMH